MIRLHTKGFLEMRWFTQKEVNKVFDHIPTRTIRWWGQMGFYKWGGEFPDGRGISREYHMGNLYQVAIVEELSSLNIPTRIIKEIMDRHFSNLYPSFDLEQENEEDPSVLEPTHWEDILLIWKRPRGSEVGKRERGGYDWDSALISPGDIYEDQIGPIERSHTMILVNLMDTMKWVDARVAQI